MREKPIFRNMLSAGPAALFKIPTIIVPGQEDPRTNVIGHTIFLNIQKPIRQPEGLYYFYGAIFDEAHHQGALGGYAHVVGDLFFVHRDMTLNIPRNKADFVEICEFGEVVPDVYYEFLNLGFKMPRLVAATLPGEEQLAIRESTPIPARASIRMIGLRQLRRAARS